VSFEHSFVKKWPNGSKFYSDWSTTAYRIFVFDDSANEEDAEIPTSGIGMGLKVEKQTSNERDTEQVHEIALLHIST
jgi:hypothetical protein